MSKYRLKKGCLPGVYSSAEGGINLSQGEFELSDTQAASLAGVIEQAKPKRKAQPKGKK